MSSFDVERILADFRTWLEDAAGADEAGPAPEDEVDLATLVAHFTALRHEVNLQTKSSRGLQEQYAQTIQQLAQAVDALQRQSTWRHQAVDDQFRPFIKALVETRDALALAYREMQRCHDIVRPLLRQVNDPDHHLPPPPNARWTPPWWLRLLGWRDRVPLDLEDWQEWWRGYRQGLGRAETERHERFVRGLDSILTGYAMSLQRLDRLLVEQDVERFDPAGQAFDPEAMEAVELVHDPQRSSGAVADVIRPGYRWRGRVFRCAQVRVVRNPDNNPSPLASSPGDAETPQLP